MFSQLVLTVFRFGIYIGRYQSRDGTHVRVNISILIVAKRVHQSLDHLANRESATSGIRLQELRVAVWKFNRVLLHSSTGLRKKQPYAGVGSATIVPVRAASASVVVPSAVPRSVEDVQSSMRTFT